MYLVLLYGILNFGLNAFFVIPDIRQVCFERFILVLPVLVRVPMRIITLISRPSVYIEFIVIISVLP